MIFDTQEFTARVQAYSNVKLIENLNSASRMFGALESSTVGNQMLQILLVEYHERNLGIQDSRQACRYNDGDHEFGVNGTCRNCGQYQATEDDRPRA